MKDQISKLWESCLIAALGTAGRKERGKWIVTCALLLGAIAAEATVIGPPTVVTSATPFSGGFVAANSVDGNPDEYASAGLGAGTFVEYTFGSAVTFDRVITVQRDSPSIADRFGSFTLTYDVVTSGSIAANILQGHSDIYSLGSVTTTLTRWDVDTLAGFDIFENTGLKEIIFLNTPADSKIVTGVTTIGSSTPFSADFVAANAVNGVVGLASLAPQAVEFATTAGLGTFVDYDLGSEKKIVGFDFIDRFTLSDKTTDFDLIFSTDATFGNAGDTTLSFSKGTVVASGSVFAGINARFVRYDVTAAGAGNLGVNEMIFYSEVPEPTTVSLLALGGLLLAGRRQRRSN